MRPESYSDRKMVKITFRVTRLRLASGLTVSLCDCRVAMWIFLFCNVPVALGAPKTSAVWSERRDCIQAI